MSVVDLHPEELLDKDQRDELTDDERARLDAHLDRCAACRAEVVLRSDFAAELHGFDADGRADRPSALLDLVQGALAAPPLPAPAPAPAPVEAPAAAPLASPNSMPNSMLNSTPNVAPITADMIPGLRRRPRRTAVVLLGAAALMAASAAGATGLTGRIWLGLRGNSQEVTHASTGAMPKAAPAATSGSGAGAVTGSTVAHPASPVEATDVLDVLDTTPVSDPIAPAPALVAATSPARSVALVSAPLTAPRPSAPVAPIAPPVAAVAAPVATVAPAPAPTTASALFDSANAARHDGDTAVALARYDALDKQFPQTTEARIAKATTGKLLLDRGDAAGALARFDAYLASSGGTGANELREEAMAGRATALERLGRGDDEVRAWMALLAAYPATPYAVHAKTRVARSLGR
jgi:hypothetical protein